MRALFERSGLSLSKKQLEQFWTFHELLRARNEELDLTRLHNFESMVLKLYVDSALVARLIDVPSPLLDLGTGAGFPGIPLKIVRPDVQLILAETRAKRVRFLHEAVEKLDLCDVEIRSGRISRTFEGRPAAVITRAVESIPDTLHRVAPWLPPGARVIFMKGPESAAEVASLQHDFATQFKINVDRAYDIPETPQKRRLVVVERLADASTTSAPSTPRAASAPSTPHATSMPSTPRATSAPSTTRATSAAQAHATSATRTTQTTPAAGVDPSASAEHAPATRRDVSAPAAGVEDAAQAHERPPHGTGAPAPERLRFARVIGSESNPNYKRLMALHRSRGIRKSGRALVGGMRAILEIVAAYPERCASWITAGPPAPPPEVPPSVDWYQLSPKLFREIDVFGTGPPLLEVRVPDLEPWSDADWPPGCTLFVPFQDPENVGAILRSAAAFDVTRVVLLAEAANPFHPRSLRAAGGSPLLKLPMFRGPSIGALRVQGAPLVALAPTGDDVGTFAFPETFGLLPGIEGPGLPHTVEPNATLAIPMSAGVESLNAASASAIALYVWRRQSRESS